MDNLHMEELPERLLVWYDAHARRLPWREEPTPYHVWVSEIMLQQTRVEAVKPFYHRFLTALPTIMDLAQCGEDRLLKLWEGLGYYNRVRNMQKAARIVLRDYGGELPHSWFELKKLPGIGNYTAGAIASIAYGVPAPAVDGNVLRVLSRIYGSEKDIQKQSVKQEMEQTVMDLMPAQRSGAFNQALMELGAVVCVPNGAPHCEVCPVSVLCRACQEGTADRIPVRTAKKPRRIEQRTVLVIRGQEHSVIRKRQDKGLLSGLYELPNVPGRLTQAEALQWVREQGFCPIRIQPLEEAKHIFSHVEWRMTGYMVLIEEPAEPESPENQAEPESPENQAESEGPENQAESEDPEDLEESESPKAPKGSESPEKAENYLFIEPARTEREYAIPAAFAAYARYMEIRLGQEKFDGKEL